MHYTSLLALLTHLTLLTHSAAQNYHPSPQYCTISQYNLFFLKTDTEYKLHELWPNVCEQCIECEYPTCCDPGRLNFTIENLPALEMKFLEDKWYRDSARFPCSEDSNYMVSLFEHEYFKHASCIGIIKDTTDFLELAMTLWYKYHNVIPTYCNKQAKLVLGNQFNLQYVDC